MTERTGGARHHQWDAQNQVTAYQDEAGQVTTLLGSQTKNDCRLG
ncbi:hypothetical protein ACVXG8_01230 [Escherichia coli]